MFLAVKLLLHPLSGYHGTSNSYDLNKNWAQVGKYNFRFLAFKTEWKYYFWIGKYESKRVFDHFSPNYHDQSIFPYMSINSKKLAISLFLWVPTVVCSDDCNFVNICLILTYLILFER